MIKLDREQQKVLKNKGYIVEELPSIAPVAKITLYKIDEQGKVIEAPNLPADPIHLGRYLDRGFRTRPEDLEPRLNGDLTCEVCGKTCKSEFGLRSHLRSHKN